MSRQVQNWVYTCYFLLFISTVGAQVRFYASVSNPQPDAGAVFQLEFVLENAESRQLQLPDLHPFKIISGPSTQMSVTVINGKRSQKQSWVYRVQAPDSPGNYAINPAVASVGGKSYRSEKLTIKIQNPGSSRSKSASSPQNSRDFLLVAKADKKNTYPGDMLVLDYYLYIRKNVASIELVSFPDIQDAYVTELNGASLPSEQEVVNGLIYTKKLLKQLAIFPMRAGNIEVKPMQLILMAADEDESDPYTPFSFFRRGYTQYPVETETLNVEVKELPSAPQDCNVAAVGTYEVTLKPEFTEVSTGESFKILCTVEGRGDMKRVQAPELRFSADADVFEVKMIEELQTYPGSDLHGKKIFEYTVMINEPGEVNVSSYFCYFNTDREKFESYPVTFQVSATQGRSVQEANATDLPASIYQNNGQFFKGGYLVGIVLSLVLIFALLYFVIRKQSKTKKPLHTSKHFLNEMDRAYSARDLKGLSLEFQRLMTKAAADLIAVDSGKITRKDIEAYLVAQSWPESERSILLNFLQLCDLYLYSGSVFVSESIKEQYTAVRKILNERVK